MLSDFISLIYPQNCSGCDALLVQSEKGICSSCLIELEKISIQNPITSVHFARKEIDKFISCFHLIKGSILLNIIHNIKYNNNKVSANTLGVELGKKLRELRIIDEIECIVPVPISLKKQRVRKFNQSEEIAKGIKKVIDIPIETNWLLRKNSLKSQTFSNRFERSQNVKEEYYLNKKKTLSFKRLLILDDVVTTGSTIVSCLEAIGKENNFSVCIASVALTKKV
jgi:ComF family protein